MPYINQITFRLLKVKTGNEQAGSENVRQGCYKSKPFSLVISSFVKCRRRQRMEFRNTRFVWTLGH
jgi:hypothetical protein